MLTGALDLTSTDLELDPGSNLYFDVDYDLNSNFEPDIYSGLDYDIDHSL